jgi:hypothetical protein
MNGDRSGTVNAQERLGTFESERSYALERIVENVHGTVMFTHQKRKNYCFYLPKTRFPRGTVFVDSTAYRTILTVFRDFCLKARTLPRFKFWVCLKFRIRNSSRQLKFRNYGTLAGPASFMLCLG